MSDLIRRSDAIKALRCEYPTMPMFKSLREEWAIKTEGFRKAEEVIMSIPSADRPQGESILQDTIQRLERVIKHGVVGKDGMHPVSAEVMLNWLKGADDE